jgi:hypothetical protein
MALHLIRHGRAALQLLMLRSKAIERFDPSERTAQHTLALLFISVPLTVWLGVIMVGRHLPRAGLTVADYVPLAALQSLCATLLTLAVAWVLCRLYGLLTHFALFVTTQLWLKLVCTVVVFGINRATATMLFTLDELMVIGTTLYLLQLAYTWYFCKIALRCNWVYAGGIAVLMFALAGSTSDALNYYVFGTPRPILEFDFPNANHP